MLAALLILQTGLSLAQRAPAFEVASIKPSIAEPGSGSGIATGIGRLTGRNVTLKRCMRSAYNVPESQVFGGPKWIDEDRYDIDAMAAGPAGDRDMMPMLETLLAERFKLVFHRETRPLPGYALVVGKKGLAARRSLPGASSVSASTRRSIEAKGCDMGCLSRKLAEVLHVPVSDSTTIKGEFDFKLEFLPEDLEAKPASAGDATAPGLSIFAALEEQLGLKLEARKVPMRVLVIDSAEKASEN